VFAITAASLVLTDPSAAASGGSSRGSEEDKDEDEDEKSADGGARNWVVLCSACCRSDFSLLGGWSES
jgi:hypothetical protein